MEHEDANSSAKSQESKEPLLEEGGSWSNRTLSPRGWRVNLTSKRRRKPILLTAGALLLLFLLAGLRYRYTHKRGPPPFYCSTWDTASSPPPKAWPHVIKEYRHWSHYDWESGPSLDVAPTDWNKSAVSSNAHDSIWSHNFLSSPDMKPKSMADSSWAKPQGFKVVALIFCMYFLESYKASNANV